MLTDQYQATFRVKPATVDQGANPLQFTPLTNAIFVIADWAIRTAKVSKFYSVLGDPGGVVRGVGGELIKTRAMALKRLTGKWTGMK